MQLFDYSTMPLDAAISWDPTSIAGQAITNEPWRGVSIETKQAFLAMMNSNQNDNTFISKLIDFDCFMAVILRGPEVHSQIIVLDNFGRFIQGPVFYGPYAWPDFH